ncbi:MAG: ATP-binding protein [Candidatus Aenigmarchaeota archaeon]|nr:ATP-binding protein [Candidatus Aenigmarchaeota archaeon]
MATPEQVFGEWDAYAQRKILKPRDLNLADIASASALKVVAITGVRRCGKTSVLLLLRQRMAKEGKRAAYVSMEDSRVKGIPDVFDAVLKWFGDEGFLLLDEVTSATGWEGWLARNHEMLQGKLKLITSSSRRGLSIPAKPLRGRMFSYELFPLSFSEFLEFKGMQIEDTTAGRGRAEKALAEYIEFGGFPEVVLFQDPLEKIRLLGTYFKDILGLDIADITKASVSTVELFGKYALEAPYFSASKCLNFFKSLGHKIGKQRILNMERCSQDGYLFFFVPIYSAKVKDRAQYPRKAYAGDTGFMRAVGGRLNWGRLYENAVFLELRRRAHGGEEITYWKNAGGAEVDFVVRRGLEAATLIQVVYDLTDGARDRELRGLAACARETGLRSGLIITKDYEGRERVGGVGVRFVPLWKWLIAGKKGPG